MLTVMIEPIVLGDRKKTKRVILDVGACLADLLTKCRTLFEVELSKSVSLSHEDSYYDGPDGEDLAERIVSCEKDFQVALESRTSRFIFRVMAETIQPVNRPPLAILSDPRLKDAGVELESVERTMELLNPGAEKDLFKAQMKLEQGEFRNVVLYCSLKDGNFDSDRELMKQLAKVRTWTEAGVKQYVEYGLEDPPAAGSALSDAQSKTFKDKGVNVNTLVELGCLKSGGHPNLLTIFEVFDATDSHGPFMIAEAMTPIGFDLFQVANMYYNLKHDRMPIQEVQHYFWQIKDGLAYMHSKDIIHCDIKGENVVIGDRGMLWRAKIIDFGSCRHRGTTFNLSFKRAKYMAHEMVAGAKVQAPIDLWGLGYILFQTWVGRGMPDPGSVDEPAIGFIHHWISGILETPAWNVPNTSMRKSIDGLLKLNPLERWSFAFLDGRKKPDIMVPWPIPLSPAQSIMQELYQDLVPDDDVLVSRSTANVPMTTFALKVCGSLVDMYVGPGEDYAVANADEPQANGTYDFVVELNGLPVYKNDKGATLDYDKSSKSWVIKITNESDSRIYAHPWDRTLCAPTGTWTSNDGRSCTVKTQCRMLKDCLELRNKQGILLLYIQRSTGEIIGCPKANHRLRAGDWIYLARDQSIKPTIEELDQSPEQWKTSIMRTAKGLKENHQTGCTDLRHFQFYAELDEFAFPDSCDNAILFPLKFAQPGQKALNLRHRFSIGLVGIRRGGRVFGPAELTEEMLIQKGDVGLLMRVPHTSGFSQRVFHDELVALLESEVHPVKAAPLEAPCRALLGCVGLGVGATIVATR